jgi:hypothetical protein
VILPKSETQGAALQTAALVSMKRNGILPNSYEAERDNKNETRSLKF